MGTWGGGGVMAVNGCMEWVGTKTLNVGEFTECVLG